MRGRATRTLVVAMAIAAFGLAGACSDSDGNGGADDAPREKPARGPTTSTLSLATTVLPPPLPTLPPPPLPPTGVLIVRDGGAELFDRPGGQGGGRLRAGVVVAYDAIQNDWAAVTTPCGNRAWVQRTLMNVQPTPVVVLDPGHGGKEPGATGPTGLTEKAVNLDIARRADAVLRSQGIAATLTRTDDYRATIDFRAAVAKAVNPAVFVSIHHNAEPDESRSTPGSEVFYQFRSSASKRLAGLVYEETVAALQVFPAQWAGDTDAGAKWRLNDRGGDYYGILRKVGEVRVTAALAELAFISNPSEEALLRQPDVRQRQAEALVRAIVRFLNTSDPGSGFTTPYPRSSPAGPGGGSGGCTDPN